jgi:ABC-type sugar transport system substrate-binding protein
LVKQPEEPWFQTEWKFADKAGKDLGIFSGFISEFPFGLEPGFFRLFYQKTEF